MAVIHSSKELGIRKETRRSRNLQHALNCANKRADALEAKVAELETTLNVTVRCWNKAATKYRELKVINAQRYDSGKICVHVEEVDSND